MKSNIAAITKTMMSHWPDATDEQAEEIFNDLLENGALERVLTKYLTNGAWEPGAFENEVKTLCENTLERIMVRAGDADCFDCENGANQYCARCKEIREGA